MQQEFLLAAILSTAALCAGATLVLSYLHWKDLKARRVDPGLPHQKAPHQRVQRLQQKAKKPWQGDHWKKAKPLDGLLRDHPSQRKTVFTPGEVQRLEQDSRTRL
jgi:hypothetical protein